MFGLFYGLSLKTKSLKHPAFKLLKPHLRQTQGHPFPSAHDTFKLPENPKSANARAKSREGKYFGWLLSFFYCQPHQGRSSQPCPPAFLVDPHQHMSHHSASSHPGRGPRGSPGWPLACHPRSVRRCHRPCTPPAAAGRLPRRSPSTAPRQTDRQTVSNAMGTAPTSPQDVVVTVPQVDFAF